MRAFGNTLVILEIKEEVKNKLGLIITEANDRDIRYKLGEVFMVGEDVVKIAPGDKLYYDKVNASELRLDGVKYLIINLSDVRVVI
jgi:co-chaperonin GroES (HSP10)